MSGTGLLQVRELCIANARGPVLDRVSLEVRAGEVVGVIGESGAGKSTLGLAALGVIRPGCRLVSGSVQLQGRELTTLSAAELRDVRQTMVSYVAQSAAAAFNPAFRIGAQIAEVPIVRSRLGREDAAALTRMLFAGLGLPDTEAFCARYPHQLSGGQLQRAMIAMALASNPRLVVFDEPTTALDVVTQLEVLRTIRDAIRSRHIAVLYITHDIAVVSQIANRILVLRHGQMVEEGLARAIVTEPRTPYVQALVATARGTGRAALNAESASILEVRNAVVGYGATNVVDGLSFSLRKGGVLAMAGESGSGKSTVARMLMGLIPPRSGTILFDGKALPAELEHRSREQRRRIQLVHQLPDMALNPRHRVREIIGRPLAFFFGRSNVQVEEEVCRLLHATQLDPALLDRYPASLSGGQKQRICIARALAAEPDVLICDEITSALDPTVESGIVELLIELQASRGIAILFITHNLGLVRRFAHDVVILHRGMVIESGHTTEICERPRQPYTRALIAAAPTTEPGWLDGQLSRPTRSGDHHARH